MRRRNTSSPIGRVTSILTVAAIASTSAVAQTTLLHLNGSASGDAYGGHLESVSAGFIFAPSHLLVVGVPDDDTNGVDAGRIDVRSATTGRVLYTRFGAVAGDRFGASVAQGDLNGDGRIDYLIVGADQDGTGGPGYIQIFEPLTGTSLGHVNGTVAGGDFGSSVVVLRDLDGDQVNDYAVGAPSEDVGLLTKAGAVHILSGVNNAEIGAIFGSATDALFGSLQLRLGDVDGDLVPDFAVAALGDAGMGSVTAFSQSLTPVQIWQSVGATLDEDFGQSVLIAGDLDGDATDDLLVGAPSTDDPSQPGRVALISGATGVQIADVTGANAGDRFGVTIQLGDVNGDGVDDVYVGAPGVDAGGLDRGEAFAYSVTAPGVFTFQLSFGGTNDSDAFGSVLAVLPIRPRPIQGDYLAVGVPGHDEPGQADIGQTVVVSTTDCAASSQGYGAGWPGTLGIPGISTSAPPAFESSLTLTIDNSATVPTVGLLIAGLVPASIPTRAGGSILVSPPWVLKAVSLPVGQLVLINAVPTDVRFCGIVIDLQCIELDFGASARLSFTPGLELTLGG